MGSMQLATIETEDSLALVKKDLSEMGQAAPKSTNVMMQFIPRIVISTHIVLMRFVIFLQYAIKR